MQDEYIIKYMPEDFVVQEVVIPHKSASKDDGSPFFLLRKKGFSTFQAIRRISEHLHIDHSLVSYAGLKDEDGITEQHICIGAPSSEKEIQAFNLKHAGNDSFIEIMPLNKFGPKMNIGKLVGNAFRIIIRRLEKNILDSLLAQKTKEFTFINYYDTQRFGVPGGPKNTHLIGKALLDKDYSKAISLLAISASEEATLASNWSGSDEAFFESLDARIVQFYFSAYASYQWNIGLMDSLSNSDEALIALKNKPPLQYMFTQDESLLSNVRKTAFIKPLRRFSYEPGFPEVASEVRPGCIQSRVSVVNYGMDEFHPGKYQAAVEFFLPSGCYATMLLEQLLTESK